MGSYSAPQTPRWTKGEGNIEGEEGTRERGEGEGWKIDREG